MTIAFDTKVVLRSKKADGHRNSRRERSVEYRTAYIDEIETKCNKGERKKLELNIALKGEGELYD